MVGNFYEKYAPLLKSADYIRGGSNGLASYAPLKPSAGGVSALLCYEEPRRQAEIFKAEFGVALPFGCYAPASVVARLNEQLSRPPTRAEVHAELQRFLNIRHPMAAKYLAQAIDYKFVSWDEGDKGIVIFLDQEQRGRVVRVEARLLELREQINKDLKSAR